MLLALLLASASATILDGAHIVNSGSTNSAAYDLALRSDGSARLTTRGDARDIRIDPTVIRQFFKDVKAVKGLNAPVARCMKPASFGSVTAVTYHGWRSADLTCPMSGGLAALASDVTVITNLTTPSRGRRIFLPPHEPRRVPETSPSPAATPPTR